MNPRPRKFNPKNNVDSSVHVYNRSFIFVFFEINFNYENKILRTCTFQLLSIKRTLIAFDLFAKNVHLLGVFRDKVNIKGIGICPLDRDTFYRKWQEQTHYDKTL